MSSRVIIKNLPKGITEEKLKETFSEKGVVTDVQLKFTKDGKFRHFGFVGYQSEKEADAAIGYFDKSFLNSSRISVERCAELGDEESKPKAWSKYASSSSTYKRLHNLKNASPKKENALSATFHPIVKELVEKLAKYKDDPQFEEFIELHNKKKTIWSDGIAADLLSSYKGRLDEIISRNFSTKKGNENENDEQNEEETEIIENEKKIALDETISDAEYFKLRTGKEKSDNVEVKNEDDVSNSKLFTLVLRGLPYKTKKKDIKRFFHPLKIDSIRVPTKIKGIAYVAFKEEKNAKKALLRDKSFIDGKQIFVHWLKATTLANSKENNHDSKGDIEEKWKRQEEGLKLEEDIVESGRIFVRNLPYTATEEELEAVFQKYGPISEVVIPIDKVTRKIKGYGIITYLIPENAVIAFNELDGTVFQGRMLHLLPGKAKHEETDETDAVKEGSSFKTKKTQKLKTEAASSHNWNSLFLGHNAVADLIASNYNTSKEEVLSGSNAAVRLALGETQIVNETKEFLQDSGVRLDAFNRAVNHRSKTVILAKNLPTNTRVQEIRDLFAKFGVLGRTLLPPNGVTAIVEFIEPAEARTAFRRLAYSKFKHLPLYLEWAPDNTFVTSFKKKDMEIARTVENIKTGEPTSVTSTYAEKKDGLEEEPPESDTTLFIKNLNFETNEQTIKEHFSNCGKIANVTIARRKASTNAATLLSMGYGFIQFYKQNALNVALKTLQQSTLDGHCIELKRSNRTLNTDVHVARKENNIEKQTGSKILVRNIPFQAKLEELQEIFKTFGDIKALRLPKKMVGTGSHRGFAFVEYHSKQDAKRAITSLCQSTHLYGRRLVLEWAQSSEEDIAQLRKRTADRFHAETEIRSKKSTTDINIGESDDE